MSLNMEYALCPHGIHYRNITVFGLWLSGSLTIKNTKSKSCPGHSTCMGSWSTRIPSMAHIFSHGRREYCGETVKVAKQKKNLCTLDSLLLSQNICWSSNMALNGIKSILLGGTMLRIILVMPQCMKTFQTHLISVTALHDHRHGCIRKEMRHGIHQSFRHECTRKEQSDR